VGVITTFIITFNKPCDIFRIGNRCSHFIQLSIFRLFFDFIAFYLQIVDLLWSYLRRSGPFFFKIKKSGTGVLLHFIAFLVTYCLRI
jgi:hypothetical protein